jgi:NTE family protein
MSHSTPTAFVLSGGASLGAVQVGMLRALYERRIRPDLIVATSAGAINGAFIASRPQTVETADELAAIWGRVRRSHVFPLNPLSGLLGFLGSRAHLVPESGLRRLVAERVEHERLEALPIPLHVVAVDVVSGEELLLSSGPVVDAVMASAAIPAVLPAVEWGDLELMDGGVANNTPISHAIELGAREIYVLPTGHACALERPPGSALGMALHALSLLTHSRLIADIELHTANAKLVVLPPPCPLSVLPVDFRHSAALIERAAQDARVFLDSGGSERPPIRMRMHRHAEYPRSHAGEGGVQVRDLRLLSGRGDPEEPRAPAA